MHGTKGRQGRGKKESGRYSKGGGQGRTWEKESEEGLG